MSKCKHMMLSEKISLEQARRIALAAQLLEQKSVKRFSSASEAVVQIIEQLGYLQIDTINIIERSHHHTLWTRIPDYQSGIIHQLLAEKRQIFEYWAHAMSYLPISDYRYYLPRMKNFLDTNNKWVKQIYDISGHLMASALSRIRNEGPLSIKEFNENKQTIKSPWGSIKPVKFALELLFWRGDLMVSERNKFQKVYDLTERILPPNVNKTYPNDEELGLFFIQRALQALGIAKENEILSFLQPESVRDAQFQATGKETLLNIWHNLLTSREVIPVKINELENEQFYAANKTIEKLETNTYPDKNIYFLSPFDNLIIQRDRVRWLYDFDHSLECYTPVSKRKYGYFVLPILWKDRLIGRLDPKADRKNKTLIIRSLLFEDWFQINDEFITAFTEKIHNFSNFNKCNQVIVEKVFPDQIQTIIRKNLNKW